MDASHLLQRARDAEAAYLDTLRALVEHESPTVDAGLADRLADHLAARLEADGWSVRRLPREAVGDVLVARVEGGDPDDATLLLAHYDTVWPAGTLREMPWRREGDRVHGPGTLDMKAGIATALHAVALVRDGSALRGPVTLLLTSDEESGSEHSREEIEALAREHARVLVLEPGREDGALKVGRKGVGDFEVRFEGRSAHAGNDPENGASALRELAHFLLFAEGLADPAAGTTVALTVASGGTVGNVIAERARAQVDLRVLKPGEGERVEAALKGYRPRDGRVGVEVRGGLNRPPMEPTAANAKLFEEARTHARAMGLELDGAVVGGGSDGNLTSILGVPTLDGLGSVGSGPHARHEHVRLDETLARVALLAALLAAPDPAAP